MDVVLKGDTAFVGMQGATGTRTLLVSLATLSQPRVVGTIEGVGGRLAVGDNGILYGSAYSPFGGNSPVGGVRTATLGPILLLLDKGKNILPRIKLPRNSDMFVRAIVPGAGETINVDVSIVKQDGLPRPATPDGIPTETTLTLVRDSVTGYYDAPLRVVDKDCAVELDYNEIDEQVVKTTNEGVMDCRKLPASGPWKQTDLESGPWTRLRVKLAHATNDLERVTDIRAFRLVTLGDSLTQGVQHGIVVHQDQRYSYPQQLSDQINLLLKQEYGQQVVFKQAMINEPGIGKPLLGNPWGEGPGEDKDSPGFPKHGRLNPTIQPVNNLGLSGSRVAHLHTAKKGKWPTYKAETPWVCQDDFEKCEKYRSPIDNPKEPKSVWRYVLAPPDAPDDTMGTAVEQACRLDPSLLLILIGNNDALNAPVGSDMRELTTQTDFESRYGALMNAVLDCTQGRAGIVVGTIPDVASIPHMRNLGEIVGAMPFTLPAGRSITGKFEHISIQPIDEHGKCHGKAADGKCLGGDAGGAKVGVGTLGETLIIEDAVSLVRTIKRVFASKEVRLKQDQVMSPSELQDVQNAVDGFNKLIKDRAQRPGNDWPVMDMNELFKERTSPDAKTSLKKLNGLFTGTPRAVALPNEDFLRGVGNTMLGWDGVHPNSAGYSLAANEVIRALTFKLSHGEYGGLEKGAVIAPVPNSTIKTLLLEKYLKRPRTRIEAYQISDVE
jgi:lysophospholipase L1-like esterase